MANKKDDDFDLPRHSKQLDPRHASSSSSAFSRHIPRRSVIFRLAVYAAFVLAVIYLLNYGIGTSSEQSAALPRSRSPPEAPPPRPHDDRPREEDVFPSQEKTQFEPKPKFEPKFDSKLESIPEPNLEPTPDAEPTQEPQDDSPPPSLHHEPAKTYYNGPLKFTHLSPSLYMASMVFGGRPSSSRQVLFAAGSLKSAATLLPMACQMVAEGLNSVHFALMSQDDIPMEDLLKINGVDESCEMGLFVHDARPDHAMEFPKKRMALAAARGVYHIDRFMNLRIIIVDGSKAEEEYYVLSGLRDETRALKKTLIELPSRAGSRFSWLTRLDASALAAWNDVHIDILIHTSPSGFGNLKRLLSSLAHADLDGMQPPHMTIELPHIINTNVAHYLAEYQWPGQSFDSERFPQMLSLRRRIPREKLSEAEASARFLESFWPSRPSHHHVLILSPRTEVSRQFFHYVKYSLLKYRYSTTAITENRNQDLMGFSFAAPQTNLDDVTKFVPPQAPDEWKTEDGGGAPYLWGSPSSDAMLILGDRWVELHTFVSKYLEKQRAAGSTERLLSKEVSKNHPAWLEYVLQFSRLRGYVTLYPSRETADVILGVHSDLFDAPEEFEGEDGLVQEGESIAKQAEETFDADSRVDMLATLPNKGQLPPLDILPLVNWDGKRFGVPNIQLEATRYRIEFREKIGECRETGAARLVPFDADANDLFCAAAKT